MARDLVTNLTINTDQFSNGLERARRQVSDFDRSIGGIGSRVGGTLTATFSKFAGTVGLALGAVDLLTSSITSSSERAGKFNDALSGCKYALDSFFNSLISGNWDTFNDGILQAISNGKKYSKIMRNIKTSLQISTMRTDRKQADFDKFEADATKKNISKNDRLIAYSNAKLSGKLLIDDLQETVDRLRDKLIESVGKVGIKAKSREDLLYLTEVLADPYSKSRLEGEKVLKYLNTEVSKGDIGLDNFSNIKGIKFNPDFYKSGEKLFTTKYKTNRDILEETGGLDKIDKEFESELGSLKNLERWNSLTVEQQEEIRDILEQIVTLEEKIGSAKKQYYDLNTDYIDALKEEEEDNERKSKENKEKAFEKGKLGWNIEGWVNEELNGLHDDLKRKAYNLDPVKITYELVPINEDSPDELPLPEMENIDIETNLDSVNLLKDTIVNISDASLSAADGILQIGYALQQAGNNSKGLAKTMAGVSAAATMSALIGQMVEKSKNSLTVWDWIAGITAGIATITALGIQIKAINSGKFATGGIVGGNSTYGDNVLAQVNSGEMILNTHQQANLFRMLNTGIGGAGGEVVFKIQGKELIGVLNNYNSKQSKIR